jgi:hypothetical protein
VLSEAGSRAEETVFHADIESTAAERLFFHGAKRAAAR